MRRSIPPLTRLLVAVLGVLATVVALAPASSAHPRQRGDDARIAALLKSMTLEEKVGQLFVTYAYGDSATTTDPAYTTQNQTLYGVDNGAQLVSKYHLGGVIYFAWANGLTDPSKVAALSNGLQTAAQSDPHGTPLLISVDQEGGNVSRLTTQFAPSPGNMALGATFDPRQAYATSRATGQQLRAIGINVDDAPVVDTNTNPNNQADGPRSFGDRPIQTALGGAASVLGYQSQGVAATSKHFPGLGSTSINTDNGPAISTQSVADFYKNDIPAFKAAIAAGTDEVMAGHVVTAFDPSGTPASLSKPTITGILRNQLHYNGVVVTDALGAGALQAYDKNQRVVLALQAGVDELLMPEDLRGAIAAVLAAVKSGQVSEHQIDASATRILKLKSKLGLFQHSQVDVSQVPTSVNTAAQNQAMDTASAKSITLLRNSAHTLPLSTGKSVMVTGYGLSGTQTLQAELAKHGASVTRYYTSGAPSDAQIAATVAESQKYDVTVVTTYNAWLEANRPQVTLIQALRAAGRTVVVLAEGAPYELGFMSDVPTFLAAYGYQTTSLRAAADVIYGAQPRGHLPVTIHANGDPTTPVVAAWGSGLRY